jgi:hypothetical protein
MRACSLVSARVYGGVWQSLHGGATSPSRATRR